MALFRFLFQPSDYDAAVHFFAETMGLPVVHSWDDDGLGTILQAPGAQIELFGSNGVNDPDPAERPHRPTGAGDGIDVGLLWEVDDVDALAERLAGLGVEIVSGPTDQPWGMRSMTVRGPDRILLTVAQPAGTD